MKRLLVLFRTVITRQHFFAAKPYKLVHLICDSYHVGVFRFSPNAQEVPEGKKESPGGPWQFIGILPLFDPPRHDSAETIRRALNLGVNVKMITGLVSLI